MPHKKPKPKVSKFELKHYGMFAGKTIVRVELVEIEQGFGFVPTFTFNDGTFAQVWKDMDSSGAGWVSLHVPNGEEILPDGLKTGDFET